jgi:hypothetical protein
MLTHARRFVAAGLVGIWDAVWRRGWLKGIQLSRDGHARPHARGAGGPDGGSRLQSGGRACGRSWPTFQLNRNFRDCKDGCFSQMLRSFHDLIFESAQ